eukprot:5289299-Pleurochrysis_carterae.AAC.3
MSLFVRAAMSLCTAGEIAPSDADVLTRLSAGDRYETLSRSSADGTYSSDGEGVRKGCTASTGAAAAVSTAIVPTVIPSFGAEVLAPAGEVLAPTGERFVPRIAARTPPPSPRPLICARPLARCNASSCRSFSRSAGASCGDRSLNTPSARSCTSSVCAARDVTKVSHVEAETCSAASVFSLEGMTCANSW